MLATVDGYGTAFHAPDDDVTLLFASGDALEQAIANALSDAGLEAKDVDVVASGLSGVARFDDEERDAITKALGRDIAVAAPKQRFFGETLGAGGALATTAALAWLSGARVSGLTSGEVPKKVDTVLVTAVGYYGNASAVVVRRAS